jgi:V8-like Glu-specific endopeptidase
MSELVDTRARLQLNEIQLKLPKMASEERARIQNLLDPRVVIIGDGPPDLNSVNDRLVVVLEPDKATAFDLRRVARNAKIFAAARSVAVVFRADGNVASGVLVAPDLLVTARHVLPTQPLASGLKVRTRYYANSNKIWRGSGRPDTWRSSADLDLAAIRLTEAQPTADVATLRATPVAEGDEIFLLHHPGGALLKYTVEDNEVQSSTDTRLEYLLDSAPGSSGGGLFDWNGDLVGIHVEGERVLESTAPDRTRNIGIPSIAVRKWLQEVGMLPADGPA